VTASPIGDSAPVLLALDAKLMLVSLNGAPSPPKEEREKAHIGDGPHDATSGLPLLGERVGVRGKAAPSDPNASATLGLSERTIPICEFFLAYRKTALQPGEILKTIIIPRPQFRRGLTRKLEWYKV